MAHLGIAALTHAQWEAMEFAGPKSSYASSEQMHPEAYHMLRAFYKPYNERCVVVRIYSKSTESLYSALAFTSSADHKGSATSIPHRHA